MKIKIVLAIGLIVLNLNGYSQGGPPFWPNSTLISPVAGGNIFGTTNMFPIQIFTGNFKKAEFTSSFSMGPGLGGSLTGDGLRIMPRTVGCGIPSTSTGSLDLWTTCSNGTHIKWDGSGQISGQNSRFEQWAQLDGFWFNAASNTGRYIFSQQSNEYGRLGVNHNWRIGVGIAFDAQRRLEVYDNSGAPQFRLSFGVPLGPIYTDFQTTSLGDLAILPFSGINPRRVGINTSTPTNTLEINSILASAATNNGNAAAPPFAGNATGRSGLTFSDLASSSIPQVNPGREFSL
jgi:hypothetical protein